MSAMYDGVNIWEDGTKMYPPMTEEETARWERIQEHCRKLDKEMLEYFADKHEEASVGC